MIGHDEPEMAEFILRMAEAVNQIEESAGDA